MKIEVILRGDFSVKVILPCDVLLFQELIENLGKGVFPKDGYACMNDPKPTVQEDTMSVRKKTAPTAPAPSERKTPAHSKRSRRTPSWAKPQLSDDGSSRYPYSFEIFSCVHVLPLQAQLLNLILKNDLLSFN